MSSTRKIIDNCYSRYSNYKRLSKYYRILTESGVRHHNPRSMEYNGELGLIIEKYRRLLDD